MDFCRNCGAPVENSTSSQGEEIVSIGKYIGYLFLSAVPLVGFIIIILVACGAMWKNKNLSNLAKAQLIVMGIAVVLSIVISIIIFIISLATVSTISTPSMYNMYY